VHNSMFALWPGDWLNFSTFKPPTFGYEGQTAASEAAHIANTNVSGHFFSTHGTIDNLNNTCDNSVQTDRELGDWDILEILGLRKQFKVVLEPRQDI
jgi:hypothetical protein